MKKLITFLCLIAVAVSSSSQEEKKQLSPQMHFLIGASAAAISASITEPILFLKNYLQQQKSLKELKQGFKEKNVVKTLLKAIRTSYRGLFVNASGSVPVFALQNVTYGSLSDYLKTTDLNNFAKYVFTTLGTSLVTTSLSCPRELLIVNQQNKGGNFVKVSKDIFRMHGLLKFWRGFTPTFIRNSSYSANLFITSPTIKKELSPYMSNQVSLSLISGIIAGSFSALLTHPFDTVKTYMQGNFNSGNTIQSFRTLYKIKNPKTQKALKFYSLYKGLGPRILGVACSMTTIGAIRDYLTNLASS